MGRAPCCEKIGIKRGRWTVEEDRILSNYIQSNGEGSWRSLPKNAGLKRCGKSCRLRWINYLRSDIKRGNITPEEEELIVKLHSTLGNRWSLIASHLPRRTDNEIKNYWNSHLSRKLHNFIRKSLIPHTVDVVVTNALFPPLQPHAKRKLGRTSRSAMKPKTQNLKTRKTKKKPSNVEKAVRTVETEKEEEEALVNMKINGGPCGDNLMSINGDNGVLSFDDNDIDLLLDGFSDPGHVYTSCGGDFPMSLQIQDTSTNQVNDVLTDEFIDWDNVWKEGNNSSINLWDENESLDSTLSRLLDGEDEATIGKIDCGKLGEPLDHDEENALVAWLLS